MGFASIDVGVSCKSTTIHRVRARHEQHQTDGRNIDRYSDNYIMPSTKTNAFNIHSLCHVTHLASTEYSPFGVCLSAFNTLVLLLLCHSRRLSSAFLLFRFNYCRRKKRDNEQAKINFYCSRFDFGNALNGAKIIPNRNFSLVFVSLSTWIKFIGPNALIPPFDTFIHTNYRLDVERI